MCCETRHPEIVGVPGHLPGPAFPGQCERKRRTGCEDWCSCPPARRQCRTSLCESRLWRLCIPGPWSPRQHSGNNPSPYRTAALCLPESPRPPPPRPAPPGAAAPSWDGPPAGAAPPPVPSANPAAAGRCAATAPVADEPPAHTD